MSASEFRACPGRHGKQTCRARRDCGSMPDECTAVRAVRRPRHVDVFDSGAGFTIAPLWIIIAARMH
jgi:hypothetical protein